VDVVDSLEGLKPGDRGVVRMADVMDRATGTDGAVADAGSARATGPTVSIVIVNWNTRDLLRDCLASIDAHAGNVSVETIVIDNHSADDSVQMVRREFPHVRLIVNADNRGFAAANNQGIAIARGRYVLLLNSDTVVLNGAVERSVRFADDHPEAAIVGCRTLRRDREKVQYNCFKFPSLLNLALSLTKLDRVFRRSRFFARQRMTWWDYDTPRVVDCVAGCFMLVRRDALEQVGGMDERYFMYSEETDWCWRFHRAGWKVMYTPDGTIVHFGQGSASQVANEMRVHQRRSFLMFMEKKSGKTARWIANAMFAAASLVRVPALAVRRFTAGDDARRQWEQLKVSLGYHLLGRLPESR
jgi:GT2 family glycosyltransferase